MNPSEYAKAIAGAVTAIIVYLVAHLGLEFPAEIVAALEVVVTGLVVWGVPNRASTVE